VEDGHWDEAHPGSARFAARLEAPLEPDRRQRGIPTLLVDFFAC